MLLLLIGLAWFVIFTIGYVLAPRYLTIIMRAEKFRKEGKKTVAAYISMGAFALNIIILQVICLATDTPHLFSHKNLETAAFPIAAVYIIIVKILANHYIKKDAPEMLAPKKKTRNDFKNLY